ncbi:MAG: MotA/TolQ/ExbB proton channel family protein [Acidimicrobiia bacterium]|nr:MotA/TolQ/ExbB proton channel family protein [Acidimicrobiia bacterium]MDH4307004.1 MotA/TolQ/ExbB proton channel family protein [Acidimicrobiia bacterium]
MLTIGGIALILVGLVASTVMDGNSFGPLIGPSSIVMVLLGAIGAGITSFEIKDVTTMAKTGVKALTGKPSDSDGVVNIMMKMAEVARREGVLALEEGLKDIEEPFLKQGLQLVVDGMDAENARAIMETTMDGIDGRHQTQISLWKAIGGYCPAFGMMGTLVGLINMLGNLSDPEQLGIGMSLALLTTLYGVFFSNVIFVPFANRLDALNNAEMTTMTIIADGVLAIQAGASPRMLVERLESYLDPSQRIGHQARAKGGAEAA